MLTGKLWPVFVVACVALFSTWQVGGPQDIPARQPVSGAVTLDVRPVPNARVRFWPEAANGVPAVGFTGESGHHELTTLEPRDGACIGSYRVEIREYSEQLAILDVRRLTDEEIRRMPIEQNLARMHSHVQHKKSGNPIASQKDESSLLPSKYAEVTQSGLTAIVVKGRNTINFALKSKPNSKP